MSQALSASRSDYLVMGSNDKVEVVNMPISWWEKRQRAGVHIKNPSREKLELAKSLARRLGTNTVYCYHDSLK